MGLIIRKRGVFYKDGRPISEAEQARCRKLRIPPAYTNVQVYPKTAKLQATAVNVQGKKQYYYHKKYLDRQRKKRKARASRIDFAKIKSVTRRILARPSHPLWHDALALRMITVGYLRTGVREKRTGALGAFQLKKKHVTLHADGKTVSFNFPAKSGQRRQLDARDRTLHAALSRQRKSLLVGNARYETVRDLLRRIVGDDTVRLKNIRTAASMQLFRKHLKSSGGNEKVARKQTAAVIGHTPTVSKKFYLL